MRGTEYRDRRLGNFQLCKLQTNQRLAVSFWKECRSREQNCFNKEPKKMQERVFLCLIGGFAISQHNHKIWHIWSVSPFTGEERVVRLLQAQINPSLPFKFQGFSVDSCQQSSFVVKFASLKSNVKRNQAKVIGL